MYSCCSYNKLIVVIVDGDWIPWSEWSECSRTCGDGLQLRNRTCSNPVPSNGGKECVGNATESLHCKEADCCK